MQGARDDCSPVVSTCHDRIDGQVFHFWVPSPAQRYIHDRANLLKCGGRTRTSRAGGGQPAAALPLSYPALNTTAPDPLGYGKIGQRRERPAARTAGSAGAAAAAEACACSSQPPPNDLYRSTKLVSRASRTW